MLQTDIRQTDGRRMDDSK